MADFDYPFEAVGGVAALPRGSSDLEIARWCGANEVVLITLDRGILKDQEILRELDASGTSVLLFHQKMTPRDQLWFLVSKHDRLCQLIQDAKRKGRPFRARVTARLSIQEIKSR